MSVKREVRFAGAQLRASNSDGKMIIKGRPAVYNSLSKDLGGFRERLMPGCFDGDILDPEVYATFNHDVNQIIGRVSAGTLEVGSDNLGLTMRCELPNSPLGQNIYESIRRGDVRSMSFGMYVQDEDWDDAIDNEDGEHYSLRSVKKAKLFEVSPVVDPAYEASSVGVRSLFPDGLPQSIELRSKRLATPPAVSDVRADVKRWLSAKVELSKRK